MAPHMIVSSGGLSPESGWGILPQFPDGSVRSSNVLLPQGVARGDPANDQPPMEAEKRG